jgi:hypothetical protein
MANPWEDRLSSKGKSRILSLRAALFEVRRMLEAGTEAGTVCDYITSELQFREWTIIDDDTDS